MCRQLQDRPPRISLPPGPSSSSSGGLRSAAGRPDAEKGFHGAPRPAARGPGDLAPARTGEDQAPDELPESTKSGGGLSELLLLLPPGRAPRRPGAARRRRRVRR